ncbi:ferredoxin [Streptomyces cylindrosporus]|uniref:Ferredoxin n=1 Tax=Streptomyces cylindrosporus TaxID=2927583 RepID=A0ABS9YPM0_9ACTN|nr:ferredoxin [Streptomyces cylindrosporus]MCI3278546.1 ferredoxin [Streptomyces cylindrosporus]
MRAVARIDRSLCLGMGLCEAMAADLFLLADDGIAAAQEDRGQDDRFERLRAIADCCPTGAITVAEETDSAAGHESEG